MLDIVIEFVFRLLVRIPAFLVDLVVRPGKEHRSNKWLLSTLAAVFLLGSCGWILIALLL
tara:strand:- start:56456 stop:56635 length:180 start_codon:yes stop_codon:yes gene_type:complete